MSLFSNVAAKHEVSLQPTLRQRVPQLRVRSQVIETLYRCIGILPQLVYREVDVVPAGFRAKCSVAMSFHRYGSVSTSDGLASAPTRLGLTGEPQSSPEVQRRAQRECAMHSPCLGYRT